MNGITGRPGLDHEEYGIAVPSERHLRSRPSSLNEVADRGPRWISRKTPPAQRPAPCTTPLKAIVCGRVPRARRCVAAPSVASVTCPTRSAARCVLIWDSAATHLVHASPRAGGLFDGASVACRLRMRVQHSEANRRCACPCNRPAAAVGASCVSRWTRAAVSVGYRTQT